MDLLEDMPLPFGSPWLLFAFERCELNHFFGATMGWAAWEYGSEDVVVLPFHNSEAWRQKGPSGLAAVLLLEQSCGFFLFENFRCKNCLLHCMEQAPRDMARVGGLLEYEAREYWYTVAVGTMEQKWSCQRAGGVGSWAWLLARHMETATRGEHKDSSWVY